MIKKSDILRQEDLIKFFKNNEIPHPWFPALQSYKKEDVEHTRLEQIKYSALVPTDKLPTFVKNPSWDLSIGDGTPATLSTCGDIPIQTYCTYGNENGIEPLVIHRSFHHNRPSFCELSQEFKLYHNLFEDRAKKIFYIVDDAGNESEAVRYTDDSMEIRTDLLLQFCAVKQMALAIYANCFVHSNLKLEEIGISPASCIDNGELYSFSHHISPFEGICSASSYKTLSRTLGKKFILPHEFPDPFKDQEEHYIDFIIDKEVSGSVIKNTCDPKSLANYFEANPEAPHYLTPVYFRKEVLSKYFTNPSKYSVSDGLLACSGLWSVAIDNDHDDYLTVFLGDLGRDIPESERSYWLSFNIPPEGKTISSTNFKRSFEAQFTNPASADLVFKQKYRTFREDFSKKYDWDFFVALHSDDEYCFESLHTPLNEDGSAFDDQLINLTKLLVDSLNEKVIIKSLTTISDGDKGITKLDKFFTEKGNTKGDTHIKFLRELYGLRSTSAAHRKGKNYNKAIKAIGIDNQGYREVFKKLLEQGILYLDFLTDFFELPKH